MIEFDRFSICDMPKTGGKFLRTVFDAIPKCDDERNRRHLMTGGTSPRYLFVRNPRDWYVSYISFNRYGSTDEVGFPCPIANALWYAKNLSVDSYINACLGNDSETRNKVASINPDLAINIQKLIIWWARSDF